MRIMLDPINLSFEEQMQLIANFLSTHSINFNSKIPMIKQLIVKFKQIKNQLWVREQQSINLKKQNATPEKDSNLTYTPKISDKSRLLDQRQQDKYLENQTVSKLLFGSPA